VGELRITAAAISQTVGTNVKYAGIHEFGGEIQHPGGTAYFPDKTGQLRWVSNAAARPEMPRTRAHKIPMPERSFLRSGLRDRAAQIQANLLKAAEEGMKA
jgi:phage gpG-like protein